DSLRGVAATLGEGAGDFAAQLATQFRPRRQVEPVQKPATHRGLAESLVHSLTDAIELAHHFSNGAPTIALPSTKAQGTSTFDLALSEYIECGRAGRGPLQQSIIVV